MELFSVVNSCNKRGLPLLRDLEHQDGLDLVFACWWLCIAVIKSIHPFGQGRLNVSGRQSSKMFPIVSIPIMCPKGSAGWTVITNLLPVRQRDSMGEPDSGTGALKRGVLILCECVFIFPLFSVGYRRESEIFEIRGIMNVRGLRSRTVCGERSQEYPLASGF